MQKVNIKTESGRHLLGTGYITGETKNFIKVTVETSVIDRLRTGSIIKFDKLFCKSKEHYFLGL